jgi:DNA-binding beta-propeller fold protein YncE
MKTHTVILQPSQSQASPPRAGSTRERPTRHRHVARGKLSLEQLEERSLLSAPGVHDFLYVGDGSDNTVKQFDAATGAFLGNFVSPGSGGLNGPRGLIFSSPSQLLAVNQNVNTVINGEILRYNGVTGVSLGALVPSTDPNAPFAPRGMVLKGNVLYVASLLGGPSSNFPPGSISRYDATTGKFLGNLAPNSTFFTGTGEFHPRGVVFGPDDKLYISNFTNLPNPIGGDILSFDPRTGAFSDFIAGNAMNDLNRPEGIAFGPDGNLYVTSFQKNNGDTDKIEIFAGPQSATPGAFLDKIDLDRGGQPRAFAQALLFGPGGRLFVPITGNGPDTGAVRSYNVATKSFVNFVHPSAQGGPLGAPWYLTFGNTDPATLAYKGESDPATSAAKLSSQAGASSSFQIMAGPSTDFGTGAATAQVWDRALGALTPLSNDGPGLFDLSGHRLKPATT